MQKRPSNVLLAVVISVLALFGIYIVGGLILEARQESAPPEEPFEE